MWTCLINKIYIVFLPSHSSHAWQPLDVGVFSVLKRRFRYWFRERCYGRASEATDKTDFLWALGMAWNEVVGISRYIEKGFKASGMWPVNRKLVLKNPYVKQLTAAEGDPASNTKQSSQPPDFLAPIAAVNVNTPKSSKDVDKLREILTRIDPAFKNPTTRLLFRKVGKALDDSNNKLTAAENHNNQLTSALEKATSKKRRKVEPDPNHEFVKLKDVRLVKAGLQGPAKEPNVVTPQNEPQNEEEKEGEYENDDPECIVVRMR